MAQAGCGLCQQWPAGQLFLIRLQNSCCPACYKSWAAVSLLVGPAPCQLASCQALALHVGGSVARGLTNQLYIMSSVCPLWVTCKSIFEVSLMMTLTFIKGVLLSVGACVELL